MAIKTVQAIINGQSYTLALNSATGKYEATITAPGKTSYNQPGGYYNVQVKATNDAGTVGKADASTLNGLKLYVKEKVAPVITILSPSSGAYVSNSKQPVVFTVTDETDGSGVDLSTLVVKQDDAAVASSALASTAITNGYQVTYTPASALNDGSHTVTINCKDHDGNAAAQKSTTYTVDTVPPTLNVTSPADNLVTASQSLTVAGITNGAGGAFSKTVTLAEGANTIVITATDAAGKVSTVTRNVTLDTSVPVIKSATITPNPVDAGATMVIAVEIE